MITDKGFVVNYDQNIYIYIYIYMGGSGHVKKELGRRFKKV